MKYEVRHTTRYRYQESVSHCYNMGYILPRNTDRQKVLRTRVNVLPKTEQAAIRSDSYGNKTYHFGIEKNHDHLEVTVNSLLEVQGAGDINLEFGNSCEYSKSLLTCSAAAQSETTHSETTHSETTHNQAIHNQAIHNQTWETLAAREFMLDSPKLKASRELAEYAAPSFAKDSPLLSAVMDLTQRIYRDFTYDPEFSNISTPLSQVLKHRRGVCQDFAHLGIACLRSVGYPARYVSGYLETLPPPGKKKLVGADASHAWFAVYSPGEGWFEFDPTNNKMAGEQHITTAWGRDYSDVPPLKGIVFGGGESSSLSVEVDVIRVEG